MAPLVVDERCWGAQLQDLHADECPPIRDRSCRHFKTKFCAECRWAMAVPAERVRVLTRELARVLENRRSFGMWSTAPERLGGFRFRIINNTKECHAPRLVVFEAPPPASLPCAYLGPEFLDADGMVQLCVSKGTAVPLHHVKGRERVAFRERRPNSPASSASTSPAPSRPSSPEPPPASPTLCEVLVPSVLMQLANTPVPVLPPLPEPLDKKACRMQRNRESAATSRERKRKYIAELEQQVNMLECTVQQLQHENGFWRSLEIDTYDPTCPLLVCDWF